MIKMNEDERNEVLRIEYNDKMSGDDDDYLQCDHCKEKFCPDYAEQFKAIGNNFLKCQNCGEVTN